MKHLIYVLTFLLLAVGLNLTGEEKMPKVKLTTSMGDIVLELDEVNAPISTENFLKARSLLSPVYRNNEAISKYEAVSLGPFMLKQVKKDLDRII